MSAGVIGFAIGTLAGGIIGARVMHVVSEHVAMAVVEPERVNALEQRCERAERMVRSLRAACSNLRWMIAGYQQRCERCPETCMREFDGLCVLDSRLEGLGVTVPGPMFEGAGFVSQCKEEDVWTQR